MQPVSLSSAAEVENYEVCRVCVEELALYLKPISGAKGLCAFDDKFLEFQLHLGKENEALRTKCAGAVVKLPVRLGIHASHTSHDA